MDLGGVSEKTIERLYERLGVRSFADLYRVSREQVESLDGFRDKKVAGYFAALELSKDMPLGRFVYSLGIPNVGKKTASDLAAAFGSLGALMAADADKLADVPEVGPIVAASIREYFDTQREVVRDLLAAGVNPRAHEVSTVKGKLSGTNIVLTGTLEGYTRGRLTKLLEVKGARIQSSVTAQTDIVIAGENAGSKLIKAQALGKKVITENEIEGLLSK